MRIADLIRSNPGFVSLEFFPPKEETSWPDFFETVDKLKSVSPLFTSVTYGAGGGTQKNSLEIVRGLKLDHGLEPLAHLTCVGAEKDYLLEFLHGLDQAGVHNVLALRGDPPRDTPGFDFKDQEFRYSSDLIKLIKQYFPHFCVGAAGYPIPHPESPSIREDLRWMKHKVDLGAQFILTQLFFDNRYYFDFVDRIQRHGVDVPVIPGVLPVMSLKSLKFILALCGTSIPGKFIVDLEKAFENGGEAEVRRMGIEFTMRQARELLDGGAPGVHLYTLNQAEACLEISNFLKSK